MTHTGDSPMSLWGQICPSDLTNAHDNSVTSGAYLRISAI